MTGRPHDFSQLASGMSHTSNPPVLADSFSSFCKVLIVIDTPCGPLRGFPKILKFSRSVQRYTKALVLIEAEQDP